MRVLVAGGGVGGLATAVALQGAGVDVVVLERAPQRREHGAGLSIWVSGMVALRRLGLADAVSAAGAVIEGQESRTAGGAVLAVIPVGRLARAHGLPPPVSIRRSELLRVLHDALGPDIVRTATCEGFSEDDRGVTVRLAGDEGDRGDVLIGADGIGSAVRAQLRPAPRPRYLGYQSLRAVLDPGDIPYDRDRLVMAYGRGDRFGFTAVGGGAVWWFGVIVAPEGASDGPGGRRADLLRRFRRFAPPVPQLIEATATHEILRHDIRDLPSLDRWGTGRVTLLGDAAHPVSVAGARGVSLAVEDAVVLADRLGRAGTAVDALRAYESVRRPASARAQAWSARIGRKISWRNPVACAIRDRQMRRGAEGVVAAMEAEFRALAATRESAT